MPRRHPSRRLGVPNQLRCSSKHPDGEFLLRHHLPIGYRTTPTQPHFGTAPVSPGRPSNHVGNKDGQPRITFVSPLINCAWCVLFYGRAGQQTTRPSSFASAADE